MITLPRLADEHRPLVLILAVALAARIAWWIGYVGIIENEGVEYTRLAWNWFHGQGYVSIFGGPHTLFPPFYPLLIGVTSFVTGSGETAARLVSLAGGLALVGSGYRLALRVFDRQVAGLAGGALALHPLMVALSVSTYSESLYLGLAGLGTLAAVQAMEDDSLRWPLLAGVAAGCAYLTRPEGIALSLAFASVIALARILRGRDWRRAGGSAVLVFAVTGAVGLPYVVHLSRIAGAFRWEGKSAVNNRMAADVAQGMSTREAGRGLTETAEPRGAFMFTDQHALMAAGSVEAPGLLATLIRSPLDRAETLARTTVDAGYLGSPIVVALALAGLLLTGWWRARAPEGLALLILPALSFAVLLAILWNWPRYFFPLLGTGLIWAAAGADQIGALAARVTRTGDVLRIALAAGLLLICAAQSARSLDRVTDISQTRDNSPRLAGQLIARDARTTAATIRRPLIASLPLAVAHYAGGETAYLPHADEARTLTYLRRLAPDYVALRDDRESSVPYARGWIERGIPGSCALPLPDADRTGFRIWRWTCPAGAGTVP